MKKLTILVLIFLFCPFIAQADSFDKYGGWEGIKGQKTAFFHTERIGERWWIITPEGNGFFSLGMYCIRFSGIPEKDTGKRIYRDNCLLKYKDERNWAEESLRRLKAWGFNTIGDWSSYSVINLKQMPYVIGLQVGRVGKNVIPKGAYGFFPDVFDEDYKKAVEDKIEKKLAAYPGITNDPYLLGYFTSDEPSWYGSKNREGALVDDFIALPNEAPGKKAWLDFIKGKSKDKELSEKETEKYKLDFLEKIAEQFSKIHYEAIRKFDRNHLILGSRPSRTYPEVLTGIGKYTDVFGLSFYELNQGYNIDPEFDVKIENLYKYAKKPIMLGVFITAKDSGLPYGMVRTQEDRGVSYWNYLKKVASNPDIIGLHWFQYFDPPRKCYDKKAANWGIVNDKDEPYKDMVELMTMANKRVYKYALNEENREFELKMEKEKNNEDIKIKQSIKIENPGFEFRSPWNFQIWKGNGKVALDSKVKHSGEYSVSIIGGSGSGWESVGVAVQYKPGIQLFEGVKYRLAGWVKTKGVQDKAFVRIKFTGEEGQTEYFETPVVYSTTDWQKYEVFFSPKSSGVVDYLDVQLIGKGIVWFDDLSLEVTE